MTKISTDYLLGRLFFFTDKVILIDICVETMRLFSLSKLWSTPNANAELGQTLPTLQPFIAVYKQTTALALDVVPTLELDCK